MAKQPKDRRYRPCVEELERRDTPSAMGALDCSADYIQWDAPPSWNDVAAWTAPRHPSDQIVRQDDTEQEFRFDAPSAASALLAAPLEKTKRAGNNGVNWTPTAVRYAENYVRKSIRNLEDALGELPYHDDIIQQVILEWQAESAEIEDEEPDYRRLMESDSKEKVHFRRVVRRILQREHRRSVAHPYVDPAILDDVAATDISPDFHDFMIDVKQGVCDVTDDEIAIVLGRCANKTFDEIGEELELPTSTVYDRFSEVMARFRAMYDGD